MFAVFWSAPEVPGFPTVSPVIPESRVNLDMVKAAPNELDARASGVVNATVPVVLIEGFVVTEKVSAFKTTFELEVVMSTPLRV